MSSPAQLSGTVSFGEFELDLETAELRKNGTKAILAGQPFQILVKLLDRPGQLVTREELKRQLWPSETFVDFDVSLNKAVNRLREALNDSAELPNFIETLPRRGYRFIAPVNGSTSRSQLSEHTGAIPNVKRRPPAERSAFSRVSWRTIVLILGSVSLIAVTLVLLWANHAPPPPRITAYTQVTNDGRPKNVFTGDVSGIVSDGDRVYFQEISDDRLVVGQIHASGGEVAILPTPFVNTILFDISKQRSELLVGNLIGGSEMTLWALPIPAGPPRRLGELSGQSATWSRDGDKIFFAKNSGLYSANSDGSSPRKLAELTGTLLWVRCSPDGLRLRFTEEDRKINSHSLWEIATNGKNLHRVLPGWHDPPDECCGTWTRNGEYYVFQTYARTGSKDLWILSEKSHWQCKSANPTSLTHGPLDFTSAHPSTDGNRLFAIGSKQRSELVRYDARSGFVPYMGGLSAAGLAFSADGNWLTYTATPEGTLWRNKIDGSDRLQLTYPPLEAIVPRWSPDGKWIAFSATLSNAPRNSFLVSFDGGVPQQIVPGAFSSSDPNWSPDGKSVVLWLADSGFSNKRISIINLTTHVETRLPASEKLFSPRWSPDGRYIAAITLGEQKLLVFDRLHQQWTDLANKWIGYPSWSHDGRYLYFDTLGEDPAFYRVRISNGKLERLVSLKDTHRFWSVWEPWSGLAPDDSLLLQRDTSTQEVYSLDWISD